MYRYIAFFAGFGEMMQVYFTSLLHITYCWAGILTIFLKAIPENDRRKAMVLVNLLVEVFLHRLVI